MTLPTENELAVEPAQVFPYLSIATSTIGARTKPLSLVDLRTYSDAGVREFKAVLEKAGIAWESLDADAIGQLRDALVHYVVYQALAKLGTYGPRYDQSRAEWLRLRDSYEQQPARMLGFAVTKMSNVDDSPNRPARRVTRGYKL